MSPIRFLSVISADPSIGRIDKHSLSQQTLMELLVGGITVNKYKICGYSSEIPDISAWQKVNFNESHEVIKLYWVSMYLEGPMDLNWLPLTSEDVQLWANKLTGSVDLTALRDTLRFLNIGNNRFEGTIDLTKLPANMHGLALYKNNFTGVTDFSHLPKSLVRLTVSHTQLEGEICNFDGILVLEGSHVKDMRKR